MLIVACAFKVHASPVTTCQSSNQGNTSMEILEPVS